MDIQEMSKRPSEEGHWYNIEDGSPCYTVKSAKGLDRPTTLRDAKKMGNIVPSVTTVIKESYKPGLEMYKINQAILAALTLPKNKEESEDDWIVRVKQDAKANAFQRAENGTKIHSAIQSGFEGEQIEGYTEYYEVAKKEIEKETGHQDWICEKSFASVKYGYGGKIDLLNDKYLIDIKTKEGGIDDIKLRDEHFMQLAGYGVGVKSKGRLIFGVLFASENKTVKLLWVTDSQMRRGWTMFYSLLNYWYAKTGLIIGGQKDEDR